MKKSIAFFLIVLITIQLPHKAKAQVGGAIALGAALTALSRQVKEILEKAQAAGQILEVEAANQIATVIEQTRTAYRTELLITLDKVSEQASRAFNSLKQIVDDFEKNAYRDARDLERRALAIAHTLPLSKHFPQILSWNPSYTYKGSQLYLQGNKEWGKLLKAPKKRIKIGANSQAELSTAEHSNQVTLTGYVRVGRIPNDDDIVSQTDDRTSFERADVIHFTIDGDFYDLPSKRYNAEITKITVDKVETKIQLQNSTKSSLDIAFDIPKANLKFSETEPKYNYVTVRIPYKKSVFLFFKKKDYAEFTVQIITLPKNIGKLSITTTVKVPDVEVQSFTIGPYSQMSDDDDIKCGGEHADLAIHCTPPEPGGWKIRPRTVSYRLIKAEGDWRPCGPDHSGLANACYSFITVHHRFGTSGKIWFYLTYDAERDVMKDQTETVDVPINWEESKVFKLPTGASWKGTFIQFDGKRYEFSGPFSNVYLNVSQSMNDLSIRTIP